MLLKEFIQILSTYPEDTKIKVARSWVGHSSKGWYPTDKDLDSTYIQYDDKSKALCIAGDVDDF